MLGGKMKRIRKHSRSKELLSKKAKIAILAGSISLPFVAYAAVGVNIGVVQTQIQMLVTNTLKTSSMESANTTRKITTDITKFTADHTKRIFDNTNEITDAIKVATKQEAMSAQAMAEINTKSTQTLNSANQAVQNQTAVIEATKNFGANGQGYGACAVYAKNTSLDKAANHVDKNAAQIEATTVGTNISSPDANTAQAERVRIQREEFCSSTQAGTVCEASDLPAGDMNAAVYMGPANKGSKEQLAKKMFRENLLNSPTPALGSPDTINSPQGQEHVYQTTRQAAIMGAATHSLSYIDAQNLRSIERDGKMFSANELINDTVGRYYGGEEAKKWQASMIAQEPRGLLVEAARIHGLGTWLSNRVYKQNLRMEANLASILLTTAEPVAKDVRKMSSTLESQRISDSLSFYR